MRSGCKDITAPLKLPLMCRLPSGTRASPPAVQVALHTGVSMLRWPVKPATRCTSAAFSMAKLTSELQIDSTAVRPISSTPAH